MLNDTNQIRGGIISLVDDMVEYADSGCTENAEELIEELIHLFIDHGFLENENDRVKNYYDISGLSDPVLYKMSSISFVYFLLKYYLSINSTAQEYPPVNSTAQEYPQDGSISVSIEIWTQDFDFPEWKLVTDALLRSITITKHH